MYLFSATFPENHASMNSQLFFHGSVVIIVELSKSKLCPFWEVCSCTNDVATCHRMATYVLLILRKAFFQFLRCSIEAVFAGDFIEYAGAYLCSDFIFWVN